MELTQQKFRPRVPGEVSSGYSLDPVIRICQSDWIPIQRNNRK